MTRLAAAVAAAALLAAGCGDGDSATTGDRPQLIVSAASSLRDALAAFAAQFAPARVRLSFGGSDELAARVRAGAPADVFAAANTTLPARLHADGHVERPVRFTANRLVIAVARDDDRITGLDDLIAPGTKLAVGAPTVPIGSYTRDVLAKLGAENRARILTNVKSEEPDVAGIVGKLTQGAVDAGLVYATDVAATKGRLRAIELPRDLRPSVVYAAAVTKRSRHKTQARQFVRALTSGAGQAALRRAGFAPLPR